MFKAAFATAAFVFAGVMAPAQAASLVGDGSYKTFGDLTLIEDGGVVLEWLDLTVTTGLTLDEAVTAFSPDGFAAASYDQVQTVLGLFGIVAPDRPFGVVDTIDSDATSNEAFQGRFGITSGAPPFQATLGSFINVAGVPFAGNGYVCVGDPGCSLGGFVSDEDAVNRGSVGTFLVRTAEDGPGAQIPVPATLPLAVAGLGALALLRRRG